MSARLTFEGLEQLKAELRRLPAELKDEGGDIVAANADGAAADMHYPRRTGDLQKKVRVEHQRSQFGAISIVKNTSKYALPFEAGTQARHTAIGANRGSMPPGNVFFPAIRKARRKMYSQLKALLMRKGLSVTGDA